MREIKIEDYYIGRLFIGHNNIIDYSPLRNIHLVDSDVVKYVGQARFMMGMKLEEDE